MFDPHGLTEHDLTMIKDYIDKYGSDENNRVSLCIPIEDYLSAWSKEKSTIYDIFGKNLILRERVSFTAGEEELERNMEEDFFNCYEEGLNGFCGDVVEPLTHMLVAGLDPTSKKEDYTHCWLWRRSHPIEAAYISNVTNELRNIETFVKNAYPEKVTLGYKLDDIKVPVISAGQKPFKVINALISAFEKAVQSRQPDIFTPEFFSTLKSRIERYRIKHSQALNGTTLFGNLCLSIHPLDFITASDNTYDWESCMTWTRGDPGEYRLGTVEMMNSPIVIVAYLEGDRPFHPFEDDRTWSNKKWREFFIFDRDVISTIRSYPYESPSLEKIILEKLADLAHQYGWPAYNPIARNRNPIINGHDSFFETEMMYNDAQYYESSYMESSEPTGHFPLCGPEGFEMYRINYSGVCICPICGKVFTRDNNEADVIVCEECEDISRCPGCNARIMPYDVEDEEVFDIGGQCWCNNCAALCDICGEAHPNSDMSSLITCVQFENTCLREKNFIEGLWVHVCSDCREKIKSSIKELEVEINDRRIWAVKGSEYISPDIEEPYYSKLRRRVIETWQNSDFDSGVIINPQDLESARKIS